MPGASRVKKIVKWSVIGVSLAVIVVKGFFVGSYRIPQDGMYPTLPAGSRFYTLKRTLFRPSDVKRGDIVVFVREQDGKRYNYIWRVIALPGDSVESSGESLAINNNPVRRERIGERDGKMIFHEEIGEVSYEIAFDPSPRERPPDVTVTIPPEHFFVMGDNRFDAVDSRYFGPIRFDSIIGKKL